ncbi:MAG TPA: FHA domain-containing protein [Blastocatellia bacterium]|nr:FHA domain-containing protein [Blastocatellia bacterium]
MIRCNNCGTNNIAGSEYCDECGMKLAAAEQSTEPPVYKPPSAVESEPVSSKTIEGPLPAPPSFTTSTSVPKPAMPARERGSDSQAQRPHRDGDRSTSEKPAERRLLSRERDPREQGDSVPRGAVDNRAVEIPRGESPRGEGPRGEGRAVERGAVERGANDNNKPDHKRAEPSSPGKTFVLSSRGRTEGLQPEHSAPPARSSASAEARLVIERGGRVGKEFLITGIETNIGRWDADSGIFPDVDLDEDDPEAKISRRHARIINHNGQYFIEDLGSTNGTFVNRGRRLLPGKRQMLQNGDEVIVGKTFLKFQILR